MFHTYYIYSESRHPKVTKNPLNPYSQEVSWSSQFFVLSSYPNNICINVFSYKNGLVYPVHVSHKKIKDYIDLLLKIDENKSHYVYIKDFNRFMCNKTINKNKKNLCKYWLKCFNSEKVFQEHKKT